MQTFSYFVRKALTANVAIFQDVQDLSWGLELALLVVFCSALSEALGQSLVLLANRVKPRRFFWSLFLSAAVSFFGFIFWTLSVWLVGRRLFGITTVHTSDIMRAVGLGYAPYLFSFFILVPYFGSLISTVLSLWRLVTVVSAVNVVLDLGILEAALCSVLGWGLLQFLKMTVGRPIISLTRWAKTAVAGVKLQDPQEFIKSLEAAMTMDIVDLLEFGDALGEGIEIEKARDNPKSKSTLKSAKVQAKREKSESEVSS